MKRTLVFALILILGISFGSTVHAQTVPVSIGTGTDINNTFGHQAPCGIYSKTFREQFLILANEINNAGGRTGNIKSLAFHVSEISDFSPITKFRIRLKHTSQTALTSTFETGDYQQVFQADSFMPTTGWNEHLFSVPFVWDGVSNLLVDIMTDLNDAHWAENVSVIHTNTSFNSSLRLQNDSVNADSSPAGTASAKRPNMRLSMDMSNIVLSDVALPPEDVQAVEVTSGSVSITWAEPGSGPLIFEDFESYPDFALSFDPWILVDLDQSITYDFAYASYPGAEDPKAYMIFNPSATAPPVVTIQAHSGQKMAVCFASRYSANDDWLISPAFVPSQGHFLNFYARSYWDLWGLERFNVGISNGGSEPEDFTIISGPNYVEAPVNWTLFSYDLSNYAGQEIRFAIQCVSDGRDVFMVDDISVMTGTPHAIETLAESTQTGKPGNIEPKTPTNRALSGYRVWRLLQGEENNEAAWTPLTSSIITDTNFLDNNWASQPPGIYKYAVKAIYTNNVISVPAFSNEVHKNMMGILAGTVTEFGTGVPIEGATVIAGEYSGSTNAQGEYSFDVYQGSYSVTCFKVGYLGATQAGVDIVATQTTTQNFVLTEIALPPEEVQAVEIDSDIVSITWTEPEHGSDFYEDFESYPNFTLSFDPWVLLDIDQSYTYGLNQYNWPNKYSPMAYMIFNPSATIPPMTSCEAHSGQKMAASFAATDSASNDWLISPAFVPAPGQFLNFYARSHTSQYGLERFKVGVSNGGTTPDDFTIISGPDHIEAPVMWTLYSYNLSSYAGQEIRFAIQCVSYYSLIFFVDDISVTTGAPDATNALATSFQSNNKSFLQPQAPKNRALTGYKIWRLRQGEEDNEAAWTPLSSSIITDTNFLDSNWASQPPGAYKYAVKAIYTNNVASLPAFSNEVQKNMMGILAGTVTDFGTSVPIEGAIVTAGEYSGTSNAQGEYSFDVYQGSYSVTCFKAGYQTAIQSDVNIVSLQTTTQNFVLTEIALPPEEVQAVEIDPDLIKITWAEPGSLPIIFEDFESHLDFSLSFDPWVLLDIDGNRTRGLGTHNWPNRDSPMAYMIFNPSVTIPPITSFQAHSGQKMAASFGSIYFYNDDWLISPALAPATGQFLNFYARSYTAGLYNLGRFKVGISNGGTTPDDFTIISGPNYVEASEDWILYSFDLSGYAGHEIRFGIECVSYDGLVFMVDDISVTTGIPDASKPLVGSTQTDKTSLIKPQTPNNRALIGYKIWRLQQGEEDNESAWTPLYPDIITDTVFFDSNWGSLLPGIYKYAVKAIYTNNVESLPAFSNVLAFGLLGVLAGTVTEFGTNEAIEGATIIAGELRTRTNAQGEYYLVLMQGAYTVTCFKEGYYPATEADLFIMGVITTSLDFALTDIAVPPETVQAVETTPDLVNLRWMEPEPSDGGWLSYCGDYGTGFGSFDEDYFDAAIRFPVSALTDYIGMSLYAVKAVLRELYNFSIRVWTGGDAAAPATMVVDQPFIPTQLNDYTTVFLDEPVIITGTEELWFGYRCHVASGSPSGCDGGPAVNGLGNMIYFQDEWTTLQQISPIYNRNWNIQGYVGFSAPERAPEISSEFIRAIGQSKNDDNRARLGYKVWRLLEGQEDSESNWTQITPETITATSCQDDQWNSVVDGTYKWAVKAIYPGDAASAPAFSNTLPKVTPRGIISGVVKDHQYAPIAGATVTAGDYSAITHVSGFYSMQVPVGTHSVTASAQGYRPSTQSDLTVLEGQTTIVNFRLMPNMIDYLEDSFESYPDFATTFAPWTTVDVDGSGTYSIPNVNFPGATEPMAFMIFNPSATVPPLTTVSAHGGQKMAASFAAVFGPNNDWLITPVVISPCEIRFWAKSYTAEYGLERFRVGVNIYDTSPDHFIIISGDGYVEAPDVWTEYVYSFYGYIGQVYLGIQCVSDDAFIFFVDDVEMLTVSADDPLAPVVSTALHGNYPNPFNPETTITYSVKEASPISIEIYNAKGQLVKTLVNEHKASGNYSVVWNGRDNNNQAVSSGVYFYKMQAGKYSSSKKMILMK